MAWIIAPVSDAIWFLRPPMWEPKRPVKLWQQLAEELLVVGVGPSLNDNVKFWSAPTVGRAAEFLPVLGHMSDKKQVVTPKDRIHTAYKNMVRGGVHLTAEERTAPAILTREATHYAKEFLAEDT
jgi:hypothetical protein